MPRPVGARGRRMTRRHFTRWLVAGGTAALLPTPARATTAAHRRALEPLPAPPAQATERFWEEIRARFLVPRELAPLNAANLCPSPAPVLASLYEHTRDVDRDPSPQNRVKLREGKETTRRLLAEYLRVTPEEIVITRNTSEANNLVSSGLDLGPGDEVIIFSDNHPSNHAAWRQKAARFGFSVSAVEQVQPHPGPDYYVEAFRRAMTSRTRLIAFTHVTNSVGDSFPVAELCRLARARGALSLVDGAQSFGVLEVDLGRLGPDFFTGSAHKWPCGPRECGVLYVRGEVHDRLAPSVVSLYPGAVGISRDMEGLGQRDEPAIIGFGEALRFQTGIGLSRIEARVRELAQALMQALAGIAGIELWTHPDPERSAAVVSLRPGALDPRTLAAALYENDGIICAVRRGEDRPGIRFSPHFYNLHEEIARAAEAVRTYITRGL